MMRALLLAIAIAIAITMGTAIVAGPPQAMASPPAKPVTAESLYIEGGNLFRTGEFEEAIEAFSRGYALDPKPEFLLNIAQCYRALGRRSDAILYFERFIRAAPDHAMRANAERTLEELRKAEALERVANGPPPVVVVQQPPAAPSPSPSPSSPSHRDESKSSSHAWLWVTAGAVVLLGGATAVYFATRPGSGPDDTIRLPPP